MKIFRIEIDNEFEADVFSALLDEENIPLAMPEEYQEKASELYLNYKKSLPE